MRERIGQRTDLMETSGAQHESISVGNADCYKYIVCNDGLILRKSLKLHESGQKISENSRFRGESYGSSTDL